MPLFLPALSERPALSRPNFLRATLAFYYFLNATNFTAF
jgi:hypothetical protein